MYDKIISIVIRQLDYIQYKKPFREDKVSSGYQDKDHKSTENIKYVMYLYVFYPELLVTPE